MIRLKLVPVRMLMIASLLVIQNHCGILTAVKHFVPSLNAAPADHPACHGKAAKPGKTSDCTDQCCLKVLAESRTSDLGPVWSHLALNASALVFVLHSDLSDQKPEHSIRESLGPPGILSVPVFRLISLPAQAPPVF